jgi:hypothetical protein
MILCSTDFLLPVCRERRTRPCTGSASRYLAFASLQPNGAVSPSDRCFSPRRPVPHTPHAREISRVAPSASCALRRGFVTIQLAAVVMSLSTWKATLEVARAQSMTTSGR